MIEVESTYAKSKVTKINYSKLHSYVSSCKNNYFVTDNNKAILVEVREQLNKSYEEKYKLAFDSII
jgi:hypothetical protein